jgi:hypothetical protein
MVSATPWTMSLLIFHIAVPVFAIDATAGALSEIWYARSDAANTGVLSVSPRPS